MLLKGSIPIVFTCPLLSWCKISNPFRRKKKKKAVFLLLKGSIPIVFTCPLLSWCKISNPFRRKKKKGSIPVSFPHLHVVGQLVIVSHHKDKKLPWPLPAHPSSKKAVGIWYRENPYSEIHSVPSYVSRQWRCPLSPARMYRWGFYLHWGWDPKAFFVPLWYFLRAPCGRN